MKPQGATIAATIAVLLALIIGGGLIYIYSGAYNIAATDGHTDLGRWLLRTIKLESIQAHAEPTAESPPPDSTMIRQGFHNFQEMCVVCHGAPGVEPGWMGKGLRPDPPKLSKAVTMYSEGELRWILKHGIKMAGMPALAPTHSDLQIQSIVAFIQTLPETSPEEYAAMSRTAQQQGQGQETGGGHQHTH